MNKNLNLNFMKNVKIFALAALVAFGLASCNKEIEEGGKKQPANGDVAYLSVKVDMEPVTRAAGNGSNEEAGNAAENGLKSLYLITLDDAGKVLSIPGGNATFIKITATDYDDLDAVKVSATAKNLIAIANPGTKLLAKLNGMSEGTPWATINAAINKAKIDEIQSTEKGFTMITAGDATDVIALPDLTPLPEGAAGDAYKIKVPYVDINGKVKLIETTEELAKAAAEASPVTVRLERLASKLNVKVAAGAALDKPTNSTFDLLGWTVDVVNTTFFPYAVKVLTDGTHTVTPGPAVYANHFYTQDPNFNNNYNDAEPPAIIAQDTTNFLFGYADKDATPAYTPKLAQGDWMTAGDPVAYVIENTMNADAQRFGNATRLVIKATYYPEGFTSGDWFAWAGEYYTFATLKAAYTEAAALTNPLESPLYVACEAFLTKVKLVKSTISAANFGALQESDLASIENGGDVVKDGKNAVIRWYKNGLNYYYYEIRHDNQKDTEMAFSKYGVVRNNSYKLTLNKVKGPGTPWYPDVNDPGDGDPDPKDPIDEATGFLGIEVERNPWILWETGFEI